MEKERKINLSSYVFFFFVQKYTTTLNVYKIWRLALIEAEISEQKIWLERKKK